MENNNNNEIYLADADSTVTEQTGTVHGIAEKQIKISGKDVLATYSWENGIMCNDGDSHRVGLTES